MTKTYKTASSGAKKKFENESKMFAKFFGIDDRMECYCNMYLQH